MTNLILFIFIGFVVTSVVDFFMTFKVEVIKPTQPIKPIQPNE